MALVASAGEEPRNRDILVELIPMQAFGADLEAQPLFARRLGQAREPREGNAKRSAVAQFQPRAVLVEAQRLNRDAHSRPFRTVRSYR